MRQLSRVRDGRTVQLGATVNRQCSGRTNEHIRFVIRAHPYRSRLRLHAAVRDRCRRESAANGNFLPCSRMLSKSMSDSKCSIPLGINAIALVPPRPFSGQHGLVPSLAPPVHRDRAPREARFPKLLQASTRRCNPIRRFCDHARPWNAKSVVSCPKTERLGYRKLCSASLWMAMTSPSPAPAPKSRKPALASLQSPP